MNRYQKLNRYERQAQHQKILEQRLHGEGLYVYKNNSNGELMLPKPTSTGLRKIPAKGEFQGDSYFMSMVKSNMLLLVKEVISPAQQKAAKAEETILNENKLILDQPERVTVAGKTEHVVVEQKPVAKLAETNKPEPQKEILLNEGPADMEGITIIQ